MNFKGDFKALLPSIREWITYLKHQISLHQKSGPQAAFLFLILNG